MGSKTKWIMRGICGLGVVMALCAPGLADGESAVNRNQYKIEIALDAQQKTLSEKIGVTVFNDSGDVWNELCFRDFVDCVLSEDDETCGVGMVEMNEDGTVAYAGPTLPPDSRHMNGSSGITAISCGGRALDFAVDADDASIIYVTLQSPLAPGESAELDIEYKAQIPLGGYRCAWHPLNYDGDGETYELAQFYPMLSVYENGAWINEPYFWGGECMYTRCADYDITLDAPEGYTVAASGDEVQGATADGMTRWNITAENMRDATIFISNECDMLTGSADGTQINVYYARDDADTLKQAEISLETAQAAIAAFDDYFGAYAYGGLDVVQSNYTYGGMEAPGLVRISSMYSWFIDEEDTESGLSYADKLRGTVAHEIAHEWFYGAVGNDQYNEAWLDESFAAFGEQIYWRKNGRAEQEIAALMSNYSKEIWSESDNCTINRSYGELDWDYTDAVYKRGAAFLYGLEQAAGVDKFREFMREYYAAYTFSEAHTDDFLAMLEPYIKGNDSAHTLIQKYLQ